MCLELAFLILLSEWIKGERLPEILLVFLQKWDFLVHVINKQSCFYPKYGNCTEWMQVARGRSCGRNLWSACCPNPESRGTNVAALRFSAPSVCILPQLRFLQVSLSTSIYPISRWSFSTWPWTSGISLESGSILFNYRSKSLAKLKTKSFVGSRMVFWPVDFIFNVLLISSEMFL